MQEVLTLLDLALAALREKKEIFSRLEREPELILTDLFDPSLTHPYYEFPFRAVEHSKELGSPQIDYHQLQEQLADMVANLFAGMDPEIEISLKNKHYYPSPCIIRYHGYPIVEFDFYRHTFTDLLKGYAATLKREAEKAAEREKACKEEYATWAHRCAEPSTMLRNASWWDRLLFFLHKKKFMAAARFKAKTARDDLEWARQEAAGTAARWQDYMKVQPELGRKYEFWERFFREKVDYQFIEN